MIDEQDLTSYLTVKRSLTDSSLYSYLQTWKRAKEWFVEHNLPLHPTSAEKYIFHMKKQGVKNSTLNVYLNVFTQIDAYCRDRNLPHSLCDGFKKFEVYNDPIDILTLDEVERLTTTQICYKKHANALRDGDTMFRVLTMFLADTGCRITEATTLTMQYLDINSGYVHFVHTKNKDSRKVFFGEPLLSELKMITNHKMKDDELVFTNRAGSIVHQGDFLMNLRRRTKEAGIKKKIHPHLLRHTYGTHLYMATKDIGLVSLVLGHKDIKTTMRYMHLADDSIKIGQYKHPRLRRYLPARFLISEVEQALKDYHLDADTRFNHIKIYEAISTFVGSLYKAVV